MSGANQGILIEKLDDYEQVEDQFKTRGELSATRMGRVRAAANHTPSLGATMQNDKLRKQRESSARLSAGGGSQNRRSTIKMSATASTQRLFTGQRERAYTKLEPAGTKKLAEKES